MEGTSAPQDYGFTGEPQNSATGLVQLRARWYNTLSGRFQTHDPYSGELDQPMSLNRYLYVYDDPGSGVVWWLVYYEDTSKAVVRALWWLRQ
ncbi:MAG: hypothetical protein M3014_11570 [Chloroflexota bacterium]|nr:hypothetical protein [Chloroflexota bacterium]